MKVNRTHPSFFVTIIVTIFLIVEASSIYRFISLGGNTAFVYYGEVMLFLGPWNYVFSKPAVIMRPGLVPYVVIFAAPLFVASFYIFVFHWMRPKMGIVTFSVILGIVVALHFITGLYWGMLNTSWGP